MVKTLCKGISQSGILCDEKRKTQKRKRKEALQGWGGGKAVGVEGSRVTGARRSGEDKHIFRNIVVCVLTQEPTKIACTKHLGRIE